MKISNVFKNELFKSVFGQNFTKGDHLYRETKIVAQLGNNQRVELSPSKIRDHYNGTRITKNRLEGLVGQDHRKFIK